MFCFLVGICGSSAPSLEGSGALASRGSDSRGDAGLRHSGRRVGLLRALGDPVQRRHDANSAVSRAWSGRARHVPADAHVRRAVGERGAQWRTDRSRPQENRPVGAADRTQQCLRLLRGGINPDSGSASLLPAGRYPAAVQFGRHAAGIPRNGQPGSAPQAFRTSGHSLLLPAGVAQLRQEQIFHEEQRHGQTDGHQSDTA